MMSPLDAVRVAAIRLEPLSVEYAFLGGCAVPLLLDRRDRGDFRATRDVDVVVKIVCKTDFYALEDLLRANGFRHVIDGPIFRWTRRRFID